MTDSKLHYERPNLVLLHGWGYDQHCWPDNLVASLKRQFNVILLSLPGHGATPECVIEAGDCADSLDQLDQWLDTIQLKLPDRYHLLAWSLGGQVAIRLAHNNGSVDRIILLATNPKFVNGDDWRHAMQLELLMQFVQNYKAHASKAMHHFARLQAQGCEQSKALVAYMVAHMTPKSSKLLGLKLLQTLDERAHLLELSIPCLIELAHDDKLVPVSWVTDLNLPNTTVVKVVAGGHGYVLQNQNLASRIIEFLTLKSPPLHEVI